MALPEKMDLRIVTPERQLFSGLVDRVTVPSTRGYLGILPGHAPLLAELGIGNISYEAGGRVEYMTCAWGFLEVLPDRVIVLAHSAEVASEIDASRAEQAKLRAERRLASKDPDVDFTRAQLALMRAAARLDAVSRMRHRPILPRK
jgi:F-type H+-transporting ATPase subunit epsilon